MAVEINTGMFTHYGSDPVERGTLIIQKEKESCWEDVLEQTRKDEL